jgi:hypothetical protein
LSPQQRRLNVSQAWPWSIDGYFPHGTAGTVQGVCQWLITDQKRESICTVLFAIVEFCQLLTVPHLILCCSFLETTYGITQKSQQLVAIQSQLSYDQGQQKLIDLNNDCFPIISLVQNLVIEGHLNYGEQIIFHRQAPTQLLAAYESLHHVFRQVKALVH